MELKYSKAIIDAADSSGSNRTFMELKYSKAIIDAADSSF